MDNGAPGDAHQEATRPAIATSLAEQVQQLRALPSSMRNALRDPPGVGDVPARAVADPT